MERLSRGFRLLGASWEVLKADRELMLLPVFSFVAMTAVGLSFFGLAAGYGLPSDGRSLDAGHYILLAGFYFSAYAIGIFFNAAIVGAATIRLDGRDPKIGDGLKLARARLGKILAWAALAASVGLLLRMLGEKFGWLGRIVIAIIGAAWSAITFFVVPILLYEPLGVNDSVRRSASLFKQRWGEQFVGNVSIGLAMFVISIPAVALTALLMSIAPAPAILVGIVAFGLIGAAGSAMTGIFNAALYRFATTGNAPGPFATDDLSGAFCPRRRLFG